MGKLLPMPPLPKNATKEEMLAYSQELRERLNGQMGMVALLKVAFGLFLAMIIGFVVLFSKSI